jgi:hypothetical protein
MSLFLDAFKLEGQVPVFIFPQGQGSPILHPGIGDALQEL